MKNFILLILLSVFVLSCNNSKKNEYSAFQKQFEAKKHPGKKLMETNCYVCHSPSASHEDRIAPPMIAIKKHYINDDTTKEQFIEAMQAWIKNPNQDDAKMYGAVRRFGVMPKTPYPEETIKQISDFMFDYDIEQPEWFEDHFNEEKGKRKRQGMGKGYGNGNEKGKQQSEVQLIDLPYNERGLQYALTTKAVLGKNLIGNIQKKGILEALAFCNEKAYPLTDSMSALHNAVIKRVSDKPRNQKNQANAEELVLIEAFKKVVSNEEEPNPIVKEMDKKVKVFYPIKTNTMCLQCHGKPNTTINSETLKKITALYPNDKAIGYDVNQVRGIWSISFDK